jgi:hypothetical protein
MNDYFVRFYESWISLTIKKEHRLRVCGDKVLKIFRPKREEVKETR